jgi:hypothetical protein
MAQEMNSKPGRPRDYYTAKEVTEIFPIGLSTLYRKSGEFGGRVHAGRLMFPRVIIDTMRRKDGALESV